MDYLQVKDSFSPWAGLPKDTALPDAPYGGKVEASCLLNLNLPAGRQCRPMGNLMQALHPPRKDTETTPGLTSQWGSAMTPFPEPATPQSPPAPVDKMQMLQMKAPPGLSLPDDHTQNQQVGATKDSKVEATKARPLRFAPKKRDLLSQYETHDGPIVTLMIRNIPCRVTQQQLLDVVDAMGFSGKYNFLYLPTGGRSSTAGSSNLGYGFINFMDPSDAVHFTHSFKDYQFEGTSSTKVCTVRPAHIQGLQNNIHHFDRTATSGRPRERGPFILEKEPQEITCPSMSQLIEDATGPSMKNHEDLNLLDSSYFDFLEDASDAT